MWRVVLGDELQFTFNLLLTTAAGLPGSEDKLGWPVATPLLREGMKIE